MLARLISAAILLAIAVSPAVAVEIIAPPQLPAGFQIVQTPRGPVFATAAGMSIYKAVPKGRAARQVEVIGECVFQCPEHWPPLRPALGAKPVGDFTIVKGVDGKDQWAFKGVLLQTFKFDRKSGDTLGDETFDFNGPRVPVGEAAWVESPVPPAEPAALPPETKDLPPGVAVQFGFRGNRYFANTAGFTLYAYEAGKRCTARCLAEREPLAAGSLSRPMGDWAVLAYDDGTRLWAYKGKPVYTYRKDKFAGEAAGDEPGVWRALIEYEAPIPAEIATAITETGMKYVEAATGKTLYYQGFNHRPYIYVGFNRGIFSNCYNDCAEEYPPLLAPQNAKPVGEWWVLTRVDGKKQWAYRGLPVYTYRDDVPGRHLASANGRIWTEAIANNPNTLKLR